MEQISIGIIAGVVSAVAYIWYLASIFSGGTKPNRATWWVLTLAGAIAAASYYAGGARNTIWVPLVYVLGPFLVALLSLRYGEAEWTAFETRALMGAGASVFLWWLFSSPLVALLMNITIDFFGILPTIRKSYLRPHTEDRRAWMLEFAANGMNLFAIERWAFAIWVYPVYLVLVNGIITVLLFRKQKTAS